ncbi:MAG: hypothetical protein AMXMBFR61_16510 [Fimbriimonadales bacterium]
MGCVMRTRAILLVLTLFAASCLAMAQSQPPPTAVDTLADLLSVGKSGRGGPSIQSDSFPFPARVTVHPDRGWLHGERSDFRDPGPGLEATEDPGTLRLAPLSTQTFLSRDFSDGLQGMTTTGAFRVAYDPTEGYHGLGAARVYSISSGSGTIVLCNQEYDPQVYPEFELYYKAEWGFPGYTLYARVKVGMVTYTLNLLDIRDRGEDGAPMYDSRWHRLRLDIGSLLSARGYPTARVVSLYLSNSTPGPGPQMWLDDVRIFGAEYSEYADYVSPAHRLPMPKEFDTLYWAKARMPWWPKASVVFGDAPTTLKFQMRSAGTYAELSSATWLGPTSAEDWYEADDLLMGQAPINPAHNGDSWIQVRVRLGSSPDRKHTPVLEDFCVTWGEANTWDVLMLLFRSIDADYVDGNGNPGHETYTMPQSYVDDLLLQWRFFMIYGPRFLHYQMKFRDQVEVIETPLTEAHLSDGPGSYVVDATRALPLYQQWTGAGKWDSIMMHFRWEKVPFPAWGIAWWPNFLVGGAAMTQIIYLGPQYPHHEVMLHEWMHSFAWTIADRTDTFVPHPHTDNDPEWDGTGLTSMDYYYHCLVYHGDSVTYAGVDLVDPVQSGYERQWLTLGSFTFTSGQDGLRIDWIDEANANPWYGDSAGGSTWSLITSSSDFINLRARYGTGNRVAYGGLYLHSTEDQLVRLWTGTDDGFRLWLNNELLRDRKVNRGASANSDSTGLFLGAGWNHLLIKVENTGGDWGYYGRLAELEGGTPSGVTAMTQPIGYSGFETVRGALSLGPYTDPTRTRVRMEVRHSATGEVMCGRWVIPGPNGEFLLSPVPKGTWTLWAGGAPWLGKSQPLTVTSDITGLNVSLFGGDANDDGAVDLLDLQLVLLNYGRVVPHVDVDGSGSVDLGDLNMVLTSFGRVGDP